MKQKDRVQCVDVSLFTEEYQDTENFWPACTTASWNRAKTVMKQMIIKRSIEAQTPCTHIVGKGNKVLDNFWHGQKYTGSSNVMVIKQYKFQTSFNPTSVSVAIFI